MSHANVTRITEKSQIFLKKFWYDLFLKYCFKKGQKKFHTGSTWLLGAPLRLTRIKAPPPRSS
jgi:hypothetical protein